MPALSLQRVEPHLLNEARRNLLSRSAIVQISTEHGPWFHPHSTPPSIVSHRLAELKPIHAATTAGLFTVRAGQTLEIAVFKALVQAPALISFGHFRDLNSHDDSALYRPPAALSGRSVPGENPSIS